MEVQKIGDGSPQKVQWSAAKQVQRVAEENSAAQLKTKGVPLVVSPVDENDRTFSPALFAQAAQFQLYTQSGTLAAMLANTGAAAISAPAPVDNDGEKIAPVEKSTTSGKLDARA